MNNKIITINAPSNKDRQIVPDITQSITMANHLPLVLFAGVNVLESRNLAFRVAEKLCDITTRIGMPLVFKASIDKANRSSINSFRGLGIDEGLKILQDIKQQFSVPIITDVHTPEQAPLVADVVDILQLPAFLSRQTDLVIALAKTKKIIHIKKAQFLSAAEMQHITHKFNQAGNDKLILCERGSCFGYNNLIVDMLNFGIMKQTGYPVTFDATHSLQLPGSLSHSAGGRRHALVPLARAGIAQKIAGLFLETHPNPDEAKCDGPCAIPLAKLEKFLKQIKNLDEMVKNLDDIEIE